MSNAYAGIGSRTTPANVLDLIRLVAGKLSDKGWTLRTGDANGADRAFREASRLVEAFRSTDARSAVEEVQPWAFKEVQRHLPTDRSGFEGWKPYVQGLLARNMMQVLGRNGDDPVKFVLCWAPSLYYDDSSAGGTGYAVRCALAHGIPVYNLFDEGVLEAVSYDPNGFVAGRESDLNRSRT